MRQRAKDLGMEIEEFAKYKNDHPEEGHDAWCDGEIRKLSNQNNLIVEGRLTHIFLPYAFKIKLVCPVQTCAQRRARDCTSEAYLESLDKILGRDVHDELTYDELYPGWNWDNEDYDIWVDTGVLTPNEVLSRVLVRHDQWLKYLAGKKRLLVSP